MGLFNLVYLVYIADEVKWSCLSQFSNFFLILFVISLYIFNNGFFYDQQISIFRVYS